MMNNIITAESFGADCPTNWEEIAFALNEIIEERGIENDRDELDALWESYWRGELESVPAPIAEE